jgi:hypothetical protein
MIIQLEREWKMGRKVRRVPKHWQHPKTESGDYVPLLSDYHAALKYYNENPEYHDDEYTCPDPADYMPLWGSWECTHYQMYETTTEGTPISPVMETPEELAQWLADNNASWFGSSGALYEEWLPHCKT